MRFKETFYSVFFELLRSIEIFLFYQGYLQYNVTLERL